MTTNNGTTAHRVGCDRTSSIGDPMCEACRAEWAVIRASEDANRAKEERARRRRNAAARARRELMFDLNGHHGAA